MNLSEERVTPDRGEVIVFTCPYKPEINCLKRVVGVSGDKIQIKGKRLFINNVAANYIEGKQWKAVDIAGDQVKVVLEERVGAIRYDIIISDSKLKSDFGPFIVPPGHVFVLGDNRDLSEDSRSWGAISVHSIRAKAMFIWMSFDWNGVAEKGGLPSIRWGRLFRGFNTSPQAKIY